MPKNNIDSRQYICYAFKVFEYQEIQSIKYRYKKPAACAFNRRKDEYSFYL